MYNHPIKTVLISLYFCICLTTCFFKTLLKFNRSFVVKICVENICAGQTCDLDLLGDFYYDFTVIYSGKTVFKYVKLNYVIFVLGYLNCSLWDLNGTNIIIY